jgi:hypothetical protein
MTFFYRPMKDKGIQKSRSIKLSASAIGLKVWQWPVDIGYFVKMYKFLQSFYCNYYYLNSHVSYHKFEIIRW